MNTDKQRTGSFIQDMLEEKRFLKVIFEMAPVGMFIVDDQSNVVEVNRSLADFAGKEECEFLGVRPGNALDCVHTQDDPRGCGYGPACETCRINCGIQDALGEGGVQHRVDHEMTLSTVNGEAQRHLQISTAPLSFDGQGPWVLVVAADVTELKARDRELADQRVTTEQLKVVTEMAGTVAHEVSQPLQAITGYADFACAKFGSEEGLGKMLATIKANADRITGLIRKMQNIRSYQPRPYANGASIVDIDRPSEAGKG